MGVVYTPGQVLERGDLKINTEDSVGNPTNVYSITYALYYVDPDTQLEVLIGDNAARIPVNPAIGEYYASVQVPANAAAGDYTIRWAMMETSSSDEVLVVQEFGVVITGTTVAVQTYSACMLELIRKMRVLTRDNNPDRNYRFMPPEGEGTVGCYNQVFGFIWEDAEFAEYLDIAKDKWNLAPPATDRYRTVEMICSQKPSWKAALLWGALVEAAQALAYNWTANEFDYSLGGVSLTIEKSSKYMDLKRNAEEQWDKLTDFKVRTERYMRGLSQPRFGRGVKSSFGPALGRGTNSPRNFLAVLFSVNVGYALVQEFMNHAHHLPTLLT